MVTRRLALTAAALLACAGGEDGSAEDAGVSATPPLVYAPNPAAYVVGEAVAQSAPAGAGGAVAFSVSPPLPPGLSLDPATGIVSGTPAALAPAARHRVTAARGDGASSADLVVAVGKPASDLRIVELGNAYYYDVPAWLELHNPTATAIDLGLYTLRSRAIDPLNGAGSATATFALPAVVVPPGGYLVVAGRSDPWAAEGPGLVRVRDAAGRVPFWFGSGFAELLRGGATVDFVRFGESGRAPTTPGAWTGANAPGLRVSGPGDYGRALARDVASTDTDTGADWSVLGFGTPGGPNDVPPDARDDDGDGIPDPSEAAGGTFAGLDLHAMGARPGQRDLLVEVDWMASADPGVRPRREAIDRVVAVFAAHGIHLHVDAGDLFATGFDPAAHALGQGPSTVPFTSCITMRGVTPGCIGDLHAYKAAYLELRRQSVFHYALFGSSQNADGSAGSSGRGEIDGNDLVITLGHWALNADTTEDLHTLVNFQAGTLLHELGHNLGLLHGGADDVNDKPNYLSVMNYVYQLYGLPDPAARTAGDRYLYDRLGIGTECGLVDGPCDAPADVALEFSSGASAPLDERAVVEAAGLGRPGSAGVDFDGDGDVSATAARLDLNGDGRYQVLRDSDDWSRVRLPFQRAWAGQPGADVPDGIAADAAPSLSPVNDDDQRVSDERPPPRRLLEALQRRRR
jgi:hypothetical protein